jgi:hypothetical protein
MKLKIEFPGDEPYGKCLGRLRKMLKPHIPNLHIRRRRTGVLISGSSQKMATVFLLVFSNNYRIIEWNQDID